MRHAGTVASTGAPALDDLCIHGMRFAALRQRCAISGRLPGGMSCVAPHPASRWYVTIHPISDAFAGAMTTPRSSPIGHARDSSTSISFATSRDELEALAVEWNDLFERSATGTQVFLTHDWMSHWARIYLPGIEARGGGLAILTARRGGRLVAVWPMVKSRGPAGRILEIAGQPLSQYSDVIIDADTDTARVDLLRACWNALVKQHRPDLVVLDRVRSDSVLQLLIPALGAQRFGNAQAPCLTLAAGNDGASFETRQKSKAVRNRRRLRRRLEQGGTVAHTVRSNSAEAASEGLAALALKRDWLARCGMNSRAFADDRIERFFATVLGEPDRSAGAVVFKLAQGGRPVAYAIGFACKTRLSLHVIVHDEAFDDCGAGLLNLESCLRYAEDQGFHTFDLLPPLAGYKMQFATSAEPIEDHAIALTMRGRVVARLWYGLLRQQAKAFATKLPKSFWRLLARA